MSVSGPKQAIAVALILLFALSLQVPAQTHRRTKKPAEQTVQVPVVRPEDELYQRGMQFFQGAHYEDAISTFKKLIADYPQTSYNDLGYTYAIQSMIKLDLYSDAAELLEKFRIAYPDSPLGKSLATEIQNARQVTAAHTPAIDVKAEVVNPFASMAKDAEPVDMSSKNSSSSVPPPTRLRNQTSDVAASNSNQTSAVPPPSGLRNPTKDELAKGSKIDLRDSKPAYLSTEPIPPDVTSSSGKDSRQNSVPPPTGLKYKDPEESATSTRARRVESGSVVPTLPATMVQVQVPRNSAQAEAGKVVIFPMLIRNSGYRDEAFKLGTTLPASFETAFVQDDNNDGRVEPNELASQLTPTLNPGGVTSMILVMRVPKATTVRIDFQVTITSLLTQAAPAMVDFTVATIGGTSAITVDVEFDKTNVRRGHAFNYTVKINNNSDMPLKSVRLNYTFEDGYTFDGSKPTVGIFSDDIHTATWDFAEIPARMTTPVVMKISVTKLAEAGDGIIGYGTLHAAGIAPIQIGGAPVTIDDRPAGAAATVQPLFHELKGAPKEIVYIPYIIRNNGDHRDSFEVSVEPFGGIIFADVNRDGVYQSNEPAISRTPELEPGKDCQVLVRAEVPSNLGGSQQFPYRLNATSTLDPRVKGTGTSYITLSVPRIAIKRIQSDVQVSGGAAYYELTVTNEGTGEAKNVVVDEFLIPGSEFINASIAAAVTGNPRSDGQRIEWKIVSLMPGASQTYRVAVKRSSNAQTERATVTYFDLSGNQYAGQ